MYKLTIALQSPMLLISGESDVNMDSTIVHDRCGIPYIPGKRVRGILYESAIEVAEMMELSGINEFTVADVNHLFNRSAVDGSNEGHELDNPRLSISNLYISDYDTVIKEMDALLLVYPQIFRKERILDEFTFIRYYTSIDEESGTAQEGSLHNSRVLNRNLVFHGDIEVEAISEIDFNILNSAVRNVTAMGGKRNRGFGQIQCTIADNSAENDLAGKQ